MREKSPVWPKKWEPSRPPRAITHMRNVYARIAFGMALGVGIGAVLGGPLEGSTAMGIVVGLALGASLGVALLAIRKSRVGLSRRADAAPCCLKLPSLALPAWPPRPSGGLHSDSARMTISLLAARISRACHLKRAFRTAFVKCCGETSRVLPEPCRRQARLPRPLSRASQHLHRGLPDIRPRSFGRLFHWASS